MPNEDRIVYAKWEAADMTYSVADYVEGTDGVYSLASIRTETAKTDDTVTVQPSERSGFITPPVLSYVVQLMEAQDLTTIMQETSTILSLYQKERQFLRAAIHMEHRFRHLPYTDQDMSLQAGNQK